MIVIPLPNVPGPNDPLPHRWREICKWQIRNGDTVVIPKTMDELEQRRVIIREEVTKVNRHSFDGLVFHTQNGKLIFPDKPYRYTTYTETIPAKKAFILNAIGINGEEKLIQFDPLGISDPSMTTFFAISENCRTKEYWNTGDVIDSYKEYSKERRTYITDLFDFLLGKKLKYKEKKRFSVRIYDQVSEEYHETTEFSWNISFV